MKNVKLHYTTHIQLKHTLILRVPSESHNTVTQNLLIEVEAAAEG
jgi:hypothetical protein